MTVGTIMSARPDAPERRYSRGESLARLGLVVVLLVLAALWSWAALIFIVLFALSIIAHEFGHYIVAKKSGMKVTEAFVGFGPRIWSFRRGEVEYGLKAIPLGAYVKTPGMTNLETDIAPEDEPRTFRAQSYPKRLLMIFAGPAMNLLLALVGFCAVFTIWDEPKVESGFPAVQLARDDDGNPVGPAAQSGLRDGDVLVSIAGEPVSRWEDVGAQVRPRPGETVDVVVDRGGQLVTLAVVLGTREDCPEYGFIGLTDTPVENTVSRNPVQGVGAGVRFFADGVADTTTGIVKVFGPSGLGRIFQSVTGQKCDDVTTRPTSIVGITSIGGQAVKSGPQATLFLISVVNLALGLLNLAPILPLDGGHILMITIERIKRRRNPDYVIDYAKALPYFSVAIILMAFVMLSAVYLDTLRLF
jgi:membrane-associated protease RseP (regulator of RpoE activity)